MWSWSKLSLFWCTITVFHSLALSYRTNRTMQPLKPLLTIDTRETVTNIGKLSDQMAAYWQRPQIPDEAEKQPPMPDLDQGSGELSEHIRVSALPSHLGGLLGPDTSHMSPSLGSHTHRQASPQTEASDCGPVAMIDRGRLSVSAASD